MKKAKKSVSHPVPRRGRPPKGASGEPMKGTSVRFPDAMMDAIEAIAAKSQGTLEPMAKGDVIRKLVREALEARGYK